MTFMLVTFIQKEYLEIANVNNYLLIENENHLTGGMQHIILCHRLSICNNIDSWCIRQCQTVNTTCNYMEHFTTCCESQVNKKGRPLLPPVPPIGGMQLELSRQSLVGQ